MRIERRNGVIGLAGVLCLVGVAGAGAQAPPGDAWLPAGEEEDAAARGLRSLYVPDGLTAEQAVEQVMLTSPNVQRTRALVVEAKGGALQAMSGLVPRLELTARATKLSPVDTQGLSQEQANEIITLVSQVQDPAAQQLWGIVGGFLESFQFPSLTTQYASDASLIYSFTDSLAEALPAYRAAKKNKKAAEQQIEAELNNVAFDAWQAYYEFARAKAGVGVAESAVEAAESQRKETAAMVSAGAAARVDLMRVEAQLEAANVAMARAILGFRVAERVLQTLMHTDVVPTLGEDLSEPVTGIPSETEEELKVLAFRDRPDLQALYTYIEATEHQLKSANGGRIPDLLVRGSAQYSNPNLRVIPQQERFQGTWEVSAVIRWAPNDTIEAHGRSRQVQAALQRAHADVISLGDAIRVEVAEGYHGVIAANAATKSARLGLNAAEEGYRVKREQLQAGIVNTTDLLQAQTDLIRAQVDVVDSAVGLRIAKAQLLRAIGARP